MLKDDHRCPNCGCYPVERPGPIEKELAQLRHWLDNNTTFYDTAKQKRPGLTALVKRIWYHATDDQTSYPFSQLVDKQKKST